MTRHTNQQLAAAALLRDGRIDAYDAVYRLTDPDGTPHRNTRLADTIFRLRQKGWVIDTIEEPGKLASYVLVSAPRGDVPEPAGPTNTPEEAPAKENTSVGRPEGDDEPLWVCGQCARELYDLREGGLWDPDQRYGVCTVHGPCIAQRF